MWIQLQGPPRFAKIPLYTGIRRVITVSAKLLPIKSPVGGRFCSVDEHATAFSRNQLFGRGPIIDVTGNQIVAPFAGTIKSLSSSGDFIQLLPDSAPPKITLTLLLGSGENFQAHAAITRHCRNGDAVNEGQPLLTLNQPALRAGDPQQSRLSVLMQCNLTLSWPTSGTVSVLDNLIYEEETQTS
jgi:phosphotransferase system IIA component